MVFLGSWFMVHDSWLMIMTDTTMIDRLKQFVESEMRSCSMDFGCITPLYVYRMWGGQVPLNEIVAALKFQDPRFMFQNE